MKIDDPKITTLRAMVTAALEEFDWAAKFYEVWKIAAEDKDLHIRMGTSFATQAFQITRTALRRETLLALMRLWDKDTKSIRMRWIAHTLDDHELIESLALERVEKFGFDVLDMMRADLQAKADEVIGLTRKYMEGGSHDVALKRLTSLRHQHLAHRQLATAESESAPDEAEIEEFYRDNARLVQVLCSLVNATGVDPEDFAGVYRFYAKFFWAGARGERSKGHPDCRS